jgi:hypothetical protein
LPLIPDAEVRRDQSTGGELHQLRCWSDRKCGPRAVALQKIIVEKDFPQ